MNSANGEQHPQGDGTNGDGISNVRYVDIGVQI